MTALMQYDSCRPRPMMDSCIIAFRTSCGGARREGGKRAATYARQEQKLSQIDYRRGGQAGKVAAYRSGELEQSFDDVRVL